MHVWLGSVHFTQYLSGHIGPTIFKIKIFSVTHINQMSRIAIGRGSLFVIGP